MNISRVFNAIAVGYLAVDPLGAFHFLVHMPACSLLSLQMDRHSLAGDQSWAVTVGGLTTISDDRQLLAESVIFKNYVTFAPEYEPEKLKDELGEDFQVVCSWRFP